MNDINNWLDKVLKISYKPTDKDMEILYYLRLVQRLIKEAEINENKR